MTPATVAFKLAMLMNRLNLNQSETKELCELIQAVNDFREGDQSQFDGFLNDLRGVER